VPQLPNKKPSGKVSPAGSKYFINSVAVSVDDGRVVGSSDDSSSHYFTP